jgi:hypothetical protein
MVPALAAQFPGLGSVSADNLNTFVQSGCLLADLQVFSGLSSMTVYMLGYVAPGDGGQGFFYWNATAGPTGNNTTIIVPYGALIGAWVRIQNSNLNITAFRTVSSGSADVASTSDGIIAWNSASGAQKTEILPGAVSLSAGSKITVVDQFGDAAVNNIVVSSSVGTVLGGVSVSINIGKQSMTFVWDGSSNWVVI